MAKSTAVQVRFGIGVLGLCSFLLATTVMAQGEVSFIAIRNFWVGGSPASLAVGDFNGDGRRDLAGANAGADTVPILLGRGDGTFAEVPKVGIEAPRAMVVGDFNSDGHQDLAVADGRNNVVFILLGQGNGTFVEASAVGVGSPPVSVVVGNFNGDGRQDLAVANSGDKTVSILINNTPGVVVNDLVTFDSIRSTFTFTPDPTGCPAGFVGTFRFEARLTNTSTRALSNLVVAVTTITNFDLLQNDDGGPGGIGARLTVPREEGFADGVLSPEEGVDVPFIICLLERKSFRFEVAVLGVAE
jgi:hypothetical protein